MRADLFGDAEAVQQRWAELKAATATQSWLGLGHDDDDGEGEPAAVLVLSGDGDSESGRMAAAMLRARGREVYCVEGGYAALSEYLEPAGGGQNRVSMGRISIGVAAGNVGEKLRQFGFVVVLAVVCILFLC